MLCHTRIDRETGKPYQHCLPSLAEIAVVPASPIGWGIGQPVPDGWTLGLEKGTIQTTIGGVLKTYHANTPSHDMVHDALHPAFLAAYGAGGNGSHGSSHYNTHGGGAVLAEIAAVSVASPVGWQIGDPYPSGWSQGPYYGTITDVSGRIYNAHSYQHRQYHQQHHPYYSQLYGGHHRWNNNNWSNNNNNNNNDNHWY